MTADVVLDDKGHNVSAIRAAKPDDAEALVEIYRPSIERSHTSFEETVPSVDEMRARIAKTTGPWLVSVDDRGVQGYIYAAQYQERAAYRWSVTTSVYVAERAQGQGIGRRLYTALLPLLRAQGFVNAYAGIALPNAASVKLHEALGFAPLSTYPRVGYKLGRWIDLGWWQLQLLPPVAQPTEPLTRAQLQQTGAWHACLSDLAVD